VWRLPWSEQADAYFTLYDSKHRENWFRRTKSDRGKKRFIPLQDADWTNEYAMAPVPLKAKDIDVLCVSSVYQVKNLPFLAKALKVYRQKYPSPLIRMTLVTGKKDLDVNFSSLDAGELNELRQMEETLVHLRDYIRFVGWVDHLPTLAEYYCRAKVVVMGSLVEGKNRVIHEAMCCNTPVVCCEELNWHIRGVAPTASRPQELPASLWTTELPQHLHRQDPLLPPGHSRLRCRPSLFKPVA